MMVAAERDGDEQQADQCRARSRGHNEEVFPAVEHWGCLNRKPHLFWDNTSSTPLPRLVVGLSEIIAPPGDARRAAECLQMAQRVT